VESPKIAPSILAADFANLAAEVASINEHADMLHVDIMDGHFVPNLTLGFGVIAALRRHSELPFDCHLMTTNPAAYLDELAAAGATIVTMHIEAVPDPTAAAAAARALDLGFGLVINPGTPFVAIRPFVDLCDLVVVMSVEPGHGGQAFIEPVLRELEAARIFIDSEGLDADIEIDGGITPETASQARAAGADVFVAGTSVFGEKDRGAAIAKLRNAIT
jgi:ribulose-phosphate 3-epimerase